MPPPTPKVELIAEAILDILAQQIVTGDEYWYEPDRIERAHAFTKEMLDSSLDTIYILSPDDEVNEEMTYTDTEGQLRLDLTVARRLKASTENALKRKASDELRWTLQNRLVHDVKKALRGAGNDGEHRLLPTAEAPGGLVLHTSIPLTERSAEDTFLPGWALAFMRIEVLYDFPDGTP